MDARTGYSVLIKAAAALVSQQFMPSDDPDDYPHQTMSTRKVARMMESPRDNLRGIAVNVREGADAQAREIARLQASIDALMLEHCPDEMTPEQVANWERHQNAVQRFRQGAGSRRLTVPLGWIVRRHAETTGDDDGKP